MKRGLLLENSLQRQTYNFGRLAISLSEKLSLEISHKHSVLTFSQGIRCLLKSFILHANGSHITLHFDSFQCVKVHIKSEIWKNEAIKLSIKDLKGLLEVV